MFDSVDLVKSDIEQVSAFHQEVLKWFLNRSKHVAYWSQELKFFISIVHISD